jgi:Uncharacterized protein involved in outer membrane biogenesis
MIHLKKRYLIPGIILGALAIFLFFLSDIAKSYLVKNSEKLIHRKIEIGELHFNYAKVAVQVKNFVLYEDNKTDQFLSFSEFYINLNPWTLLQNEYSVSEIRLAEPKVQIIQNGDKFNFDSIIPKDSSEVKKDSTANEVLKFTIRNIQLNNGQLKYVDVQKNSEVDMKDLNLNLPLIAWNNEKSNMGVDFTLGEKGHVNVQASVDNIQKKYQIDLATENVDIQPIKSYMTDYFDIKSLNGALTSKLKIVGDMNEVINISLAGKGYVSDFSATDGRSEKIISAPKVSVNINDINLKTFHFGFGKIELDQPKLLVIRDKTAMNIIQFFEPYFRNDSIATANAKPNPEQGTPVTYKIDTIKVNNGLVSIADNTLNRPFNYDLNNLNVTMSGLTESADLIPVEFSTKLNNKGELSGKTIWSMLDFMKLQMDAKVKRMDLVSFSPYSEYYVASPITQGWINYDLGLKMTTTTLNNTNKVEIDELEFGKRTKDTTAMKVPVRLALYIMKDKNDQIKFDLPVSGNPSEPQFKLGKLIWKTFANLMVKTALSPFNALASLAGANPESMDKLPFAFAQDSLDQKQRNDLIKLATVLKKKPELVVNFNQTTDPEKEKLQIAIELTKAEFAAVPATDPTAQKPKVSDIKNDDINLLAFIRKTVPAVDSLGIEVACIKRTDASRVESRFQEILTQRNKLLSDFLIQNQGIPAENIQVTTADFRTLPQELKVPQFKVEVSIK